MRVFLASTGSGMSKELRDKTVKICRPRYILETFFNGEKSCLEAMSIVGNDNFLLVDSCKTHQHHTNGQVLP